jgi:hypothetical protein
MRLRLAIFAFALAALFLLINRPAYRAFFAEDDLDNLANGRNVTISALARTLLSPRVNDADNFRATTYAYYAAMARTAGLHYAPYVASIQAIHLLNVLLLWLLARALGANLLGAAAAALFYTFHAAHFDIYWKAMYAFDLLAATFTLVCLLAFVRGRTLAALLLFWLALRAKEVVIFLPLALAAFEFLLGRRRWKRVLPFFAISIAAGILAIRGNPGNGNDYTFRFTLAALMTTVKFYASNVLFLPWAGLAILAVPLFTRSRRVWFGVAAFVILLAPLLFLPGRLFAAYLYVPFIGLAIALSELTRPAWVALFFVLWIPWNYLQFRPLRTRELDLAHERRTWYEPFAQFMHAHPETGTVIWDGRPASVPEHYISGAARMLRDGRDTQITWIGRAASERNAPDLVVLVWDEPRRRLHVLPRMPDLPYIQINEDAPVWQLTSGWTGNQGHMRWTRPQATVRLRRPQSASSLEIAIDEVDVERSPRRMEVALDGAVIANVVLNHPGPTLLRVPIPRGGDSSAAVRLTFTPAFRDPNGSGDLGQPISALGFVED